MSSDADRRHARYALAVLFAINLLNFYDRQVLGAVGEAVRREWRIGDTGLGALGMAFTVLYALAGVPLGRLSDRLARGPLLAAGVFAWSVLTAAQGLARSFWTLFATRLATGIGEATCAPAATSLIGDLFPTTRRARALAVFMLGLPFGLALSYAVSGAVAQAWGWRAAFYVAAAPGLLLAVAVLRIREPARGQAETTSVGARRRPGSPLRLVLSTPTIWWLIVAGALHTFATSTLGAFLSPFLIRFHGLDIRQAGFVSMAVFGLPGIVGLMAGGAGADAAYRRRTDGRLLVAATAIGATVPLVFLGLGRPAGDVLGFGLLAGVASAAMFSFYPAAYSTVHDVVEPSLRGTAMAVLFMAVYLFGASSGPIGTGLLSDAFARRAAAAAGVIISSPEMLESFRAAGLHAAMYVVPVMGIIIAAALFAASRTVLSDAARLRAWIESDATPSGAPAADPAAPRGAPAGSRHPPPAP